MKGLKGNEFTGSSFSLYSICSTSFNVALFLSLRSHTHANAIGSDICHKAAGHDGY
uniref:Uncharacterized protein n=1 Tax=Rhizophora mucronata TaxID=61149 RepID=A0A2P2IN58_RHIMU